MFCVTGDNKASEAKFGMDMNKPVSGVIDVIGSRGGVMRRPQQSRDSDSFREGPPGTDMPPPGL